MRLADANRGDRMALRRFHDSLGNIALLHRDHFRAQFRREFEIIDQMPLCRQPDFIPIFLWRLNIQNTPFGMIIDASLAVFRITFLAVSWLLLMQAMKRSVRKCAFRGQFRFDLSFHLAGNFL